MIGDPCSWRFTPDSGGTSKRFRTDSGTYHARRTVLPVGILLPVYILLPVLRSYFGLHALVTWLPSYHGGGRSCTWTGHGGYRSGFPGRRNGIRLAGQVCTCDLRYGLDLCPFLLPAIIDE